MGWSVGRAGRATIGWAPAGLDLYVAQMNGCYRVGDIVRHYIRAFEIADLELSGVRSIDLKGKSVAHGLGDLTVGDLDPVEVRLLPPRRQASLEQPG